MYRGSVGFWIKWMENVQQKPETEAFFSFTFLSLADVTQTWHTDWAPYGHLSRASARSRAVWRKHDAVPLSAHLLHVGRQQKCGRQKLVLFVHHFSLTWAVVVGACRDEVHILADGVKQQSLKAAGEVGCVNWVWLSVEEAHKVFLKYFQSSYGDLFPPQSQSQSAIDSLEAVLSREGKIYIPLVIEEPGGVFLLGALLLQQRQQPLLLLPRAVHEVIPWLYVVPVGAGLSEDGWDGWVTANFQIIFGALIPLKKISKEACVLLSAEALLAFGSGNEVRVADGLVDIKLLLFGWWYSFGGRAGQGGAFTLLYQAVKTEDWMLI